MQGRDFKLLCCSWDFVPFAEAELQFYRDTRLRRNSESFGGRVEELRSGSWCSGDQVYRGLNWRAPHKKEEVLGNNRDFYYSSTNKDNWLPIPYWGASSKAAFQEVRLSPFFMPSDNVK